MKLVEVEFLGIQAVEVEELLLSEHSIVLLWEISSFLYVCQYHLSPLWCSRPQTLFQNYFWSQRSDIHEP